MSYTPKEFNRYDPENPLVVELKPITVKEAFVSCSSGGFKVTAINDEGFFAVTINGRSLYYSLEGLERLWSVINEALIASA
jgi:hypothetical protein